MGARVQVVLAGAAECVLVELVEPASAQLASTGAARWQVTELGMPDPSHVSRIEEPTSACLAGLATGLAGAEEAGDGAEAGVETMVGVRRR